jgi:hypothetical protein
MVMNLFKKKDTKSLAEIEEEQEKLEAEDEKLGTEVSIAKKRAIIAELKKRGLEPKHFGFDFSKAIKWLKSH